MVNRYKDLIGALPGGPGQEYEAKGEVLPVSDKPIEFRFVTSKANTLFTVFFNEVASGTVNTDAEGIAIVKTIPKLPPGEYEVRITDPLDEQSYRDTITVRNSAAIHASYAEVLEKLDQEIDDIYLARSIADVTQKYIQDSYGRTLRQPMPANFLIEEYRNLLIQLRPAYRHFGGHPYGLSQAVEAFTSVSPLVVPAAWRPTWILGQQIAVNGDL